MGLQIRSVISSMGSLSSLGCTGDTKWLTMIDTHLLAVITHLMGSLGSLSSALLTLLARLTALIHSLACSLAPELMGKRSMN